MSCVVEAAITPTNKPKIEALSQISEKEEIRPKLKKGYLQCQACNPPGILVFVVAEPVV